MPFVEISKGKFGAAAMPNNCVRINKNTISVSPNISEKFQHKRIQKQTPSGVEYEAVELGLAYDPDTKQIKLLPNAVNGFSFAAKQTNSLSTTKPRGLVRAGAEFGDYALVNEEELIFQYASS